MAAIWSSTEPATTGPGITEMGSLVPSEDGASGLTMTPVPVTWTSRLGSVEVSISRMAAIWSSTEPATTGPGIHCQ